MIRAGSRAATGRGVAVAAYAAGCRLLPSAFGAHHADALLALFAARPRARSRTLRLFEDAARFGDLACTLVREHLGLPPGAPVGRVAALCVLFLVALGCLWWAPAISGELVTTMESTHEGLQSAHELRLAMRERAWRLALAARLRPGHAGTAALVAATGDDAQARREVAHALRLRGPVPERMRAIEACLALPACDATGTIDALVRDAPANAYGWALLFEQAQAADDPDLRRRALDGLVQARGVDAGELGSVHAVLAAAGATGAADPGRLRALLRDMGLLKPASRILFLGHHCKTAGAHEAADCRRAWPLLAGASKLDVRIAGLRGVFESSDSTSRRAEAREELRRLYWLGGAMFEGSARWTDMGASDCSDAAWIGVLATARDTPAVLLACARLGHRPPRPPRGYDVPLRWLGYSDPGRPL